MRRVSRRLRDFVKAEKDLGLPLISRAVLRLILDSDDRTKRDLLAGRPVEIINARTRRAWVLSRTHTTARIRRHFALVRHLAGV